MKSLVVSVSAILAAAAAFLFPAVKANSAQISVAWDAVADPEVAGYTLSWGTNSGVYPFSNNYASNQLSATISNLEAGSTYYFVVKSFYTGGVDSDNSPQIFYMIAPGQEDEPMPPLPPPPSGMPTNVVVNQGQTNTPPQGDNPAPEPTLKQVYVMGIPPVLSLSFTNQQPNLGIVGTIGATVMIQSSTNPASPDSWTTITNIALTNIAQFTEDPQAAQTMDALDKAFVPATESYLVEQTNTSPMEFFRVVMPYDYVILASMTLPPKGYTPRLVLVRMPGVPSLDVCYVTEEGKFIRYDKQTYVVSLNPSGSTIRQIADGLANTLTLNWTSASEFIYSNGLSQLLATVVKTDPPESDPVAGPPGSPIVIDF